MTCLTICAVSAPVRIDLLMARKTILRRRLQIRDGTRVQVTSGAVNVRMTALEPERVSAVIEILVTVHTVVTGEAIAAKGEQMCLGEGNVHAAVAGLARV